MTDDPSAAAAHVRSGVSGSAGTAAVHPGGTSRVSATSAAAASPKFTTFTATGRVCSPIHVSTPIPGGT